MTLYLLIYLLFFVIGKNKTISKGKKSVMQNILPEIEIAEENTQGTLVKIHPHL